MGAVEVTFRKRSVGQHRLVMRHARFRPVFLFASNETVGAMSVIFHFHDTAAKVIHRLERRNKKGTLITPFCSFDHATFNRNSHLLPAARSSPLD